MVLWQSGLQCSFVSFVDQMVHMHIVLTSGVILGLSAIYAKYSRVARWPLWAALEALSSTVGCPWMVAGDFNIISSAEEKCGGAAPRVGLD